MKRIVLLRCNDIIYDSRAMKYVKYYREKNLNYKIIGWDRSNTAAPAQDITFYKKKIGYNIGGMKAAWGRVCWMWFLLKTLKKTGKKGMVIHACDLDSAFPAAVYKKFFNKSAIVIFDVFDWFSATLHNQNKFILTAFNFMEKFCCKVVDHLIICEQERIEQIPYTIETERLSVLPNIPNFKDNSFLTNKPEFKFDNNLLTIAYVGSITEERYLDELISLAENGIINLNMAGYGTKRIEDRLHDLAGNPHVRFYGKVKYEDGLNIMFNSDAIYAMYATISPNNVYAAPNKYYEALFLGKPQITNSGTIVEKKVIANKIGFITGEGFESIRNVVSSIDKETSANYAHNAHELWMNKFCSYTEDYLNSTYKRLISE